MPRAGPLGCRSSTEFVELLKRQIAAAAQASGRSSTEFVELLKLLTRPTKRVQRRSSTEFVELLKPDVPTHRRA